MPTNGFHLPKTQYRRCSIDASMVAKVTTQFLEGVDVVFCLLIDKGRRVPQRQTPGWTQSGVNKTFE